MSNQLDIDPLPYFSQVCENIRLNMKKQVMLKSNPEKVDETEIEKLRMEGSVDFLTLKQLNRLAQVRCKSIKDSTSKARQKLDGYFLTLQNLQYEIGHLDREINKCLEFRSRHDQIPLVDVEQFYEEAPKEISKEEITRTDKHAQTLARLDWELEQRKRLSEKVDALKNTKEAALDQIKDKKQKLQMLSPTLHEVLKASMPLQEAFNLPLDKTMKEQEMANLLPRPLFVLFLQAKAYEEACDPGISVVIDGDKNAAVEMQQLDEKKSSVIFADATCSEYESESEVEDNDDSARKKRKKSSKKMDISTENVKLSVEYHPLQVVILLKNVVENADLELKFFYYNKLGFASVKTNLILESALKDHVMLENKNLLSCLLPHDYGVKAPNSSSLYLNQNESFTGLPYIWVQNLCGLNFIKTHQSRGDDMKLSFNSVGSSISQIKSRVNSRITLLHQINQFAEGSITCSEAIKQQISPSIQTQLEKWEEISWSDYSKLQHNKMAIEVLQLQNGEEKGITYFEATFKRIAANGVKLATVKVHVVVFPQYPLRLPLITIKMEFGNSVKTAANDYNIRAMEQYINIFWPKQVKNQNQILSAQLLKLTEMIDLFVETSITERNADFEPNLLSGTNKLCPIRHQGPNRIKPFNYDHQTATYYH